MFTFQPCWEEPCAQLCHLVKLNSRKQEQAFTFLFAMRGLYPAGIVASSDAERSTQRKGILQRWLSLSGTGKGSR